MASDKIRKIFVKLHFIFLCKFQDVFAEFSSDIEVAGAVRVSTDNQSNLSVWKWTNVIPTELRIHEEYSKVKRTFSGSKESSPMIIFK